MKADSTHATLLKHKNRRVTHELKWRGLSKPTSGSSGRVGTLETAVEAYSKYNPNFEETANMVIVGLGIIIQRINYLSSSDPKLLKQLSGGFENSDDESKQLPPEKASAVERLVLSLLTKNTPTP